MKVYFIIIALTGLIYFLFAKRRFDFFTIAFMSSNVYFFPGFLGYVPFGQFKDIVNGTYVVMFIVLTFIFIGAVFYDLLPLREKIYINILESKYFTFIILFITLIAFILSILTTGKAFLSASKGEMFSHLNRWQIFWTVGASIGAVVSFSYRKWKSFCLYMLLLLFEVYTGIRMSFANTVIALFVLSLSAKGKQRFILTNWKTGVLGILLVFFIFIYKSLYINIKLGNWNTTFLNLTSSEFYSKTIIDSEPFTILSTLNEIIRQNYHVGMEHFSSIIYQFILFAPELGAKVVSFNSMFQMVLFPDIHWGMACNIWAEMWSSGGWPLLMIFVFIYVILLFLGSYLLRAKDLVLRSVVALIFSYWAFYIHRNDILYQINLEKRLILLFVLGLLFSSLIFIANNKSMQISKTKQEDVNE